MGTGVCWEGEICKHLEQLTGSVKPSTINFEGKDLPEGESLELSNDAAGQVSYNLRTLAWPALRPSSPVRALQCNVVVLAILPRVLSMQMVRIEGF